MRCITIAREITAQGESVVFFVADKESKELFDLYGGDLKSCSVVVLGTDYRDMEAEVPILRKELVERSVKVLLVDSYQVTGKYFEELSDVCALVYMDDLGKQAYPVDVLINYSGYYKTLCYEEMYKAVSGQSGKNTELLLGLKYAPLRQQFYQEGSFSFDKDKKDTITIMLSSGGSDSFNMLFGVLDAAIKRGIINAVGNRRITWKVVAGNMVKTIDELKKIAGDHPNVEICMNVSDMAGLMRSCDLAVAASGTVLTECAAVELPVICYQVADNQKYNVEYWQGTGGMVFAGDVSKSVEDRQKTLDRILDEISSILPDRVRLPEMKERLLGITDGKGAVRIAKALLELEKKED